MGAPFSISIRADVKAVSRQLGNVAYQQVPFATALALNGIAERVRQVETAALSQVFDRPTPFTRRAYRVRRATKANLTAVVFAMDAQARYLEPYEDGGLQVVGKGRKIRTPVGIGLDQYGNISRGAIRRLLARPDVFMGKVHGVNGIWQRPVRGTRRSGRYGTKGAHTMVGGGRTTLKLLVAFTHPHQVTQHLAFEARAAKVVRSFFTLEFNAALRRALATAR